MRLLQFVDSILGDQLHDLTKSAKRLGGSKSLMGFVYGVNQLRKSVMFLYFSLASTVVFAMSTIVLVFHLSFQLQSLGELQLDLLTIVSLILMGLSGGLTAWFLREKYWLNRFDIPQTIKNLDRETADFGALTPEDVRVAELSGAMSPPSSVTPVEEEKKGRGNEVLDLVEKLVELKLEEKLAERAAEAEAERRIRRKHIRRNGRNENGADEVVLKKTAGDEIYKPR